VLSHLILCGEVLLQADPEIVSSRCQSAERRRWQLMGQAMENEDVHRKMSKVIEEAELL